MDFDLMKELELNDQFGEDLPESGTGQLPEVEFLTGAAGTGKTYTMKQRIEEDPSYGILAATTGIAAVNLGEGVRTVNSLLGFYNTESLKQNYYDGSLLRRLKWIAEKEEVRNIIIDELSMMDGEQLDMIYNSLAELNDKGIKLGLVVTGDFMQLPPVKAKWAFQADCWEKFAANTTRLTKIHRQSNETFLKALNHFRAGEGVSGAKALIEAGAVVERTVDESFDGVTIMPKNDIVDRYNEGRLIALPNKPYELSSRRWAADRLTLNGWKDIPEKIKLKDTARVMLWANQIPDFEYVNGDIGHIEQFDQQNRSLWIRLNRGNRLVKVPPLLRQATTKATPERYQHKKGLVRVPEVPVSREDAKRITNGDDLTYFDEAKQHWVVGEIYYYPVKLAWATTVHKCVVPSTTVHTFTNGFCPISTVNVGDYILTDDKLYQEVTGIANTEQPLWRLQTRLGLELLASPDHPILVDGAGFVPLAEIEEGARVKVSLGFPSALDCIPVDLAWWLGATVGDGNYTDRKEGNIHFCCSDSGMQLAWKTVAEQQFNIHVGIRSDKEGTFLTSKSVRSQLEGAGLDYVLAQDKSIPKCILRGNTATRAAFLSGLFDTDGSVGKSRVVLTTASIKLAQQVHLMLLGLGIVARRCDYPGVKKRYWQVSIPAVGLDAFRQKVGFRNRKYKANALDRLRPKRILREFDGWDEVVEISNLQLTVPMINIEVESAHVFWAEGIITHNTQGITVDTAQLDLKDPFFGAPAMLYVALSRCRTANGLRIVGTEGQLVQRCATDPKVQAWI